jgi:hypothetical protein
MLKIRSFVIYVFLGLLFITSLTACNLFKIATSEKEPESPAENVAVEEEEQQPQPLVEQNEPEGEFLSCPAEGETLTLAFDHALTIEMPDVNLTHILQYKTLVLNVIGVNADGDTEISSGTPLEMNYEMMGVMSKCSVEMEGVMLASAYGTCVDGVVYLNIIESWQPASGEMICDDDIIPFQSPGAEYEHTGANGMGEVFYLTSDVNGFTTMRPFQAGSGYHSWTLYSQGIEYVPLSP